MDLRLRPAKHGTQRRLIPDRRQRSVRTPISRSPTCVDGCYDGHGCREEVHRSSTRPSSRSAENAFAGLGYDTVKLIADAIRRAGSADPKAIREALAQTRNLPGVTGASTFQPGSRIPQKGYHRHPGQKRRVHPGGRGSTAESARTISDRRSPSVSVRHRSTSVIASRWPGGMRVPYLSRYSGS